MDAHKLGFIFGFLFSQLIIFSLLALVIAAVVWAMTGRKIPFSARLSSWKVLLPAFLIVVLLNLARLGAAANEKAEPYSPRQITEIKEGCLETAAKSGQPTARVEAYCDCTVTEIRKAYPTAHDAQKALGAGVSPELKPKLIECAKNTFSPVAG